jgi:iron complex outermembrane receptor protein
VAVAATLGAAGTALAQAPAQQPIALPPVEVIATTPLPARTARPRPAPTTTSGAPQQQQPAPPTERPDPAAIDRDKVPSNTQVLNASDFDHAQSTNILDALSKSLPGVSLGDQSGNAFQRDLNYRGFTASPVPGTPQGLAIYQNGVRINEAYNDVVNWDLIPEMAINRLTLVPNSPIFGLNAIGGAISIDMKNGFNYHGAEVEGLGGSYGRLQAGAQAGVQRGNLAAYVAFDSIKDSGWRDFSSDSRLRRMYADIGARNDTTEFHVNFTGADNKLGAAAATPIEMLNQRWSSVFTTPQTTHLQLAFLTSSLAYTPTDTLSFQGNAYFRGYRASHVDGNGTDAVPCDSDPTLLCIGNTPDTPISISGPTPNTLPPTAFLGEIDRTRTASNSFGGSGQVANSEKVLGHDNHFVAGFSVDHGRTRFSGDSELGTVDQNLFVTGTGVFIDQPDADITPVNLLAKNTYVGLYATNTFDITQRLSVTAGGRFNFAQINLEDQTGTNPLLDSSNQFQRFNPVIGATYKITPNITGYAGYSEANRAPTPLELGCSDPTHPCIIDNFLVSDPPLKQVVSRTVEAGLRGSSGAADAKDRLTWGLGVFHTENTDDILNVASTAAQGTGFGFFQNAGRTLRQGVEAKVNYRHNQWNTYANYTFVDATYRDSVLLSSPNNPAADPNTGTIQTHPGDVIPGIPAHRFKAGVEYEVVDRWKVGADLNVVGNQYLIHDDTNQNAKVPAYWFVNLHGSYQVNDHVELFGLINNVFNQHYLVTGTFFETGGFTSNTPGNPSLNALTDPRTFLPGMPIAAYAGIRAKF